jgi:regulator of protease activity HflC (stomatin/prohibitin superfamily)
MLLFILGILILLIGAGILAFVPKTVSFDGNQIPGKAWGFFWVFLAIILIVLSCLSKVETRNVGVETIIGKPTGDTHEAGLVVKAPWVSITDIDATVQVESYGPRNPINVKIADGGDADVYLSYRWRINPQGADKVFQDYRGSDLGITGAVRKALVTTNVKAAINEELGTYDPLANTKVLNKDATPEEVAALKVNVVPDYKALNKAIQSNVEDKIKNLGDLIDIQSVTISGVKLPETTQKRINAFNASVQDTKIALQEVQTKIAQASGNNELAKSLQDPNVLVSKCFDALAAGDFTAPAGFSCWSGGAGSVVIPATK